MKKSIAVNTVFNVSYKLLNILFPLVTSIYLARVLGPAYIGKVSYAQSILSYFVVIASLGIPTYGMREVAKEGENTDGRNKIFSELFALNLISTLVCSIAYTYMILINSHFRADIRLYLCVGITLYMNVFNIDWFYTGQEEYVYITVRSLIIKVASLISILLFIKTQNHYIRYALITSIATTGNYFLNVFNLRNRVRFQFQNIQIKQHLKPVFIMLMTMLATDLYNQIDVTMLGLFRTDEEIGYYSNAIKLVRIIYSVTTAVSATILPRMCVFYKEKDKDKYNELFWQTCDLVLLFALPCTTGIVLVAKPLILTLFGKEFLPTAQIVQTLAPIILIISVSYLIGSVVLTSTNNEGYLLKATVGGSIVNVLLNAILIPTIGTTGAAIASVLGESTVLGIHLFYGKKYVQMKKDYKCLKTTLVACVLMAIIVVLIRISIKNIYLSLLLSVSGGVLVYFVLLMIQKNPILISLKRIKNQIKTRM